MLEPHAIYAIWLREFKVFVREKERVVSSIVSPILWLFVFGSGLGETVSPGGMEYRVFIFPGILAMSVLFTSVFYGLYIIWDRRLDFLKEVLVAPISRGSVFLGKALGGVTDAMFQGIVLLVIGTVFITPIEPVRLLAVLPVLVLVAFATASLGLVIGANMKSQEGFVLIINFVMWPMFFFSGALFPVSNLPAFLQPISEINPLTYAVDALRSILLGTGAFPLYLDIAALAAFALAMGALGMVSFGNLQQAK
ncbi:MAG: ABC transporter permease [Candidatus Micrarchaeia archaeon]